MNKNCTLNDIKMLYIRFATAYSYKFNSNHTSPEIIQLWYHEWKEALTGIDIDLIFEVFNECKMRFEWPPSIAEIIKCCDEKIGIPNIYDAIQQAINQNFTHIVVKNLFDKIGSWDFAHDSNKEILRKAKIYYPKILSEFRINRQKKALSLEFKPKEISHGSEISRDNIRRDGVRKATEYILS